MSQYKFYLIFSLLFLNVSAFSQEEEKALTDSVPIEKTTEIASVEAKPKVKSKESSEDKPFDFKKLIQPEIGIGLGIGKFDGDVGYAKFSQPLQNKIGFQGYLGYHLNDAFDVYLMYTQVNLYGSADRLNFYSNVKIPQLSFAYNFKHLYKKENVAVTPYIFTGIEGVHFETYADLSSPKGTYHYWDDGTIRTEDQFGSSSSLANIIQKDNIFETDLKKANVDNVGDYPSFVLGVPVGVGMKMKLTRNISVRGAFTYHFTYTDQLDGVSAAGTGIRKGNSSNDMFYFVNGSLSYDFLPRLSTDQKKYKDVNYLALSKADSDGDGVNDFLDECGNTPPGVAVDATGCPKDDDKDGVPNYLDEEPNTLPGQYVDEKGRTLTPEELAVGFELIQDENGSFSPTIMALAGKPVYKVLILEGKIPQDQQAQFLSLNDLETRVLPDGSQKHTVGIFTTKEDAEVRARELKQKGFMSAQVIEEAFEPERIITSYAAQKKQIIIPEGKGQSPDNDGGVMVFDGKQYKVRLGSMTTETVKLDGDIIYRIQIGAFSNPVPSSAFKGVPVIAVPLANGLTRYLSGNFDNYQKAEERRKVLVDNGFDGAYVVAFKEGVRVSLAKDLLKETPATKTTKIPEAVYSEDVRYRVQIGAFAAEPPADILRMAHDISTETLDNGLTRYFSGSYNTFEEASIHKQELFEKGNRVAFVTAYKTGNKISVKQPAVSYGTYTTPEKSKAKIDPLSVVFKIQLGIYTSSIPNSELSKFLVLKNVKVERTPGGTRYIAGSFATINEAKLYQQEIEGKGVKNTNIIAYSSGNEISLEDAIKATK